MSDPTRSLTLKSRISRGAATLALCASAAIAATAGAQSAQSSKRAMTFDDIMSLRSLGSVELSPDGQSVVYSVSEWKRADSSAGSEPPARRGHLWLVSSAGGTPHQLTFGERGESAPQWSPDGKAIAFVSSRGTNEEGQKSQIWLLPINGGEARQITHAPDGTGGFAWSPDGSKIAFLSVDSIPKAEAARNRRHDDAEVFESKYRYTHLWVIDLASSKEAEIVHGDFTLSALAILGVPQWSPDGAHIAFVALPTTLLRDLRGTVYVVTVATTQVESVAPEFRSAADGLTQPAWSPDGKTLAFVTFPQGTMTQGDSIPDPLLGNGELMLYDVSSKKTRRIEDPKFDVILNELQWTTDGRSIFFISSDRVYEDVFRYDVASGKFTRVTDKMVVYDLSLSKNNSRVAFSMETPTSPSDVYVSDLSFASPRRLTEINPQVANYALGQTEVIDWKNSDGTSVQGVLLKPVGFQAGTRYPLLVEEHGGPTGASIDNFKASATSPGQVWAGRGWAVLYPNPRGSTGYGKKFMTANIHDLGGGDYRDIMAGVDYVIKDGIADSTAMAFEGWSYGGYMAAWVVGHTSRFKAARMGAGMSDLMSMYGGTEISGYIGMLEGGMPSARTFATYSEESPITYADKVTTPLLILHGAADPRVPPGQALEFYRALKDRGKTVELVLYPREEHGFREYYHLLDRMQRDFAWISKYTRSASAKRDVVQ